ncbi:MAG: DUF4384 domain-containing protein [Thermodesulfovibrionales bacterium]|nr:DUF4384 domain-containing protein [Thermodesulfovibrionales bacterium]
MLRVLILFFMGMFIFSNLYASQSTIVESEGYACMGEDKSKKQTEQTALADAKKKAIEQVSTYIKSETHVKDFELEKDLTSAYSNATVRVIQEIGKGWYKDSSAGDCYKVKIKAEVIPDEKAIEKISKGSQAADDPSAPLSVNVWTDKKEYKSGEKIKVYIKGNKPFYAKVVYKDAGGSLIQLLPNPYKTDNYFNGGVVYEIPSGNDRFELDVSPPFGRENIIVYSSTSPVGDINLKAEGGVYQITTKAKDIGSMTRGVALKEKGTDEEQKMPAEFSETDIVLKTEK